MTVRSFGYDGSLDETKFAQLMSAHGEVAYKHGVTTGLDVTAGAGTRESKVALGTAIITGVWFDSDASVSLTHDANTGTTNRIDYVAVQVDWTANTATPVIVKGSAGGTAPALKTNPGDEGVLWQMPLARVKVRPSVTTLLASDVTICKPLPRTRAIVYTPNVSSSGPIGPNASPQTLATASVTDPGWPYRLRIAAAARFGQASGYGFIDVQANGSFVVSGISSSLSNGRAAAVAVGTSGVLTGPQSIILEMSANGMNTGDQLSLFGGSSNSFIVEVVPA